MNRRECPGCGRPALDGKATCGEARCGSSTGNGSNRLRADVTEDDFSNVVRWVLAWRMVEKLGPRHAPKAAEALEHLRRAADVLLAKQMPATGPRPSKNGKERAS